MSNILTLVVGVIALVLYFKRKRAPDLGEVDPKTRRELGRFDRDEGE